jgi:PAS domain S-box-containing protein
VIDHDALDGAVTRADLLRAVEAGEIRVHYLPIVGLADCRVIGVEALARWHRGDGVLDAHHFLGPALETGAIVEIGRQVMLDACTAVADWNEAQPERLLRLSVNASLHQLLVPTAVDDVVHLLATSGLQPERLCVEMGEDALSELGEGAIPTLEALKDLGIRLSVDDFGTGASSLVALQRHRVDELKIDRSFVAGMDDDPAAAAIVRGVAMLAASLDLELVAEGVERPAQEQMLRSLRCDAAQGWLYARPAPDLAAVVAAAEQAAAESQDRQPADHEELWQGLPTATAAARFVEAVFEAAPIGMVLIDERGRTVAANPASAAVLHHPIEDLVETSCWELVHPADLQADLDGLDRLLKGECPSYVVEERTIAADGTEHWVEVTVSGISGYSQAHGQPARLLRQVRSIEQERQASEDHAVLSSIVAATPDALVIIDQTGRCTHWHPAAERLFGWREEEMIGRPLSRLVRREDQMALARFIADAAAGTAARWVGADWVSSQGDLIAVDVTAGPIYDAHGAAIGLVTLIRDVAEQRAADVALREAHGALEAHVEELGIANERLFTFASALTHDLMQPLAALDGFLNLLDRFAVELDDDHRDWLAAAVRSKVRVAEAIDALHRAATEEQVALAPVSVATVIKEVVTDCAAAAGPIDLDAADLPVVLADRGLLAQVLVNLVQNSLRYRGDDPLHVAVTARADGDRWIVTVADNGQGIDEDELDAVFERGCRGRAAIATHGTGTGLATVRTLMRRMHGEAWAEPSERGARIVLRMQAAGALPG